jgi:hypothetical protein
MRKPFWRKASRRWYVLHCEKYVNLGPEKAEAFKEFHRLMADVAPADPGAG